MKTKTGFSRQVNPRQMKADGLFEPHESFLLGNDQYAHV